MTTEEIIEGEAVEVNEERAVAVVNQAQAVVEASPIYSIGELTDAEFEARKEAVVKGVQRIEELQRSVLKEDKDGTGKSGDWGRIKGVDRPIIYKSGVEKLASFYRLVPEHIVERTEDTAVSLGFPDIPDAKRPNRITYTVRTILHAGSQDGPKVGEGVGAATSWEKKYLLRTGQRLCPGCEKPTLRMGDKRDGSGKEWYCWKRLDPDACGQRFEVTDPRITAGAPEEYNMEPWDLENTLVKMAKKRSNSDAVLSTLGASALFTQDLEEHALDQADSTARIPSARAGGQEAASAAGDGPNEAASAFFEGTIGEQLPDQVREKTPPKWYDVVPADATVAILELKFEIGGKKHTAFIFGDAAYTVRSLELKKGDRVRTDGELHLVEWQAGKPKMRQIWWATRVDIQHPDGVWETIVANEAPPADDRDEPVSPPETAHSAALVGEVVSEGAPPATLPLRDDAGHTNADEPPRNPATLPRALGTEGGTYEGQLDVVSVTRAVSGTTAYAELVLTDYEVRYHVVMSNDDADACKVDDLVPGQEVHVAGGWRLLNLGWAILSSAVAPVQ